MLGNRYNWSFQLFLWHIYKGDSFLAYSGTAIGACGVALSFPTKTEKLKLKELEGLLEEELENPMTSIE